MPSHLVRPRSIDRCTRAGSTALVASLAAIVLAACATSGPDVKQGAANEELVAPNEHLKAEGIPPVPKSLADRVALYTEFRPVGVLEWHPTQKAMLVAWRRGATAQLHLLDRAMGSLEPLTDFPDPVTTATFEPKRGAYLVYARDTGGNEAAQLYRLDLPSRTTTLLTDPNEKHEMQSWNHAGTALAMTSTQLDRTAGEVKRETVTTDVYVLDPLKPDAKRKVASLPGGGWGNLVWGRGDTMLYAQEYRSATESAIWRIDVANGRRMQLLPKVVRAGSPARKVAYGNLAMTHDGSTLVFTSDEDGEFSQLMTLDLASGRRRVLSSNIDWDVDRVEVADVRPATARRKRELVAALVNVAGRHELHVFDVMRGVEVPLPPLPAAAQTGSVSRIAYVANESSERIAVTINSAQSPGDVYVVDLAASTGAAAAPAQQWTQAKVDGIETSSYRPAEVVRWKSFDGREISGLVYRPPSRFTGRRPVLVNIHGGPEGQAMVGFLGRNGYYVNEMGVAMILPNVRGSSGYGKTFISLDDGLKREDSVKDIGALFDWIATQPDLDPTRVMVIGGSYGGYMSLAVATNYSDRIAGSIDVVGISSFTSFLQRTETYRRDLRRVEYGDERDPAMAAFFERISPLSNAARIRKPLFVVQGLNDPRVPWQEADQIVRKVRANGVPVWYLTADNEGHGFARKPNADFQFFAQTLFMQQYLLK